MKAKTLLAVLLASASGGYAQSSSHVPWLVLKPAEFEPLTSLPWKQEGATVESILGAIFREPDTGIRYRVLLEYLYRIDPGKLEETFLRCVPLEGTQNPDALAALFVRVWADRDPRGCWEWVKRLFQVTGIEEGVLAYDGWKERSKITVRDAKAIRASPFWLSAGALGDFPLWIGRDGLPDSERVRIMKEFTGEWFACSSEWPHNPWEQYVDATSGDPTSLEHRALMEILDAKNVEEALPLRLQGIEKSDAAHGLVHEVAFRRRMKDDPKAAREIVEAAREIEVKRPGEVRGRPSTALLLMWAKGDLPGMVRWVENLGAEDYHLAVATKGMLLAFVEPEIRTRWIVEARASDREEGRETILFESWAAWDLRSALDAAPSAKHPESIEFLMHSATYGPWSRPWNQSRNVFDILSTYDFAKFPEAVRSSVFDGCAGPMEQWVSMDPGGAAKFGFDHLMRSKSVPRGELARFFSGVDVFPDEGGMIDRTFCALRVWAVIRPDEMKAWIGTIKDAKMRKALTWLLENPWGGNK